MPEKTRTVPPAASRILWQDSRPVSDPETYFDHHSATPLHPAAREALIEALDRFGDPLRRHGEGRAAETALEDAREQVADAVGARPDEIVFTSGGTESVALAVWGLTRSRGRSGRVVTTAVEHPAVLGTCRALTEAGYEVDRAGVDPDGRLDVDRFASLLRAGGVLLASVQHANHEVGTLQPVGEAAMLAREQGIPLHTDAGQTVGRLPVDVAKLGVDVLSLSGHAFGGPPGVGALYVRTGITLPVRHGDDRERRRRPGAPNLPGVVAMAAALEASRADLADEAGRLWSLTTRLGDRIASEVPGATVHGHATQRTPHLVAWSVAGVDPEALLEALDERGFRVDAGSVATGLPSEPSQVLDAMGVPDTVAFRAGLGRATTQRAVDRFVDELTPLVDRLARVQAASEQAFARDLDQA
jgi:cysteine desulfurase